MTSTHRGHGHCLAKGASPDLMFAELLGKEAGYCKGKGGSMHIADPGTGNLGANAIVGGSAGIATGAAYAVQVPQDRAGGRLLLRRGRAGAGAALRGDEPGAAVEAAGDLRVREQRLQRVHALLRVHGGQRDGSRPGASASPPRRATARTCARCTRSPSKYIERARRGEGPAFLEFKTYRYHGHHVGDIARAYYRPKAEEQEWVTKRDPVTLHGEWLMENERGRSGRARRHPGRAGRGDGRRRGLRGQRVVSGSDPRDRRHLRVRDDVHDTDSSRSS